MKIYAILIKPFSAEFIYDITYLYRHAIGVILPIRWFNRAITVSVGTQLHSNVISIAFRDLIETSFHFEFAAADYEVGKAVWD